MSELILQSLAIVCTPLSIFLAGIVYVLIREMKKLQKQKDDDFKKFYQERKQYLNAIKQLKKILEEK